MMISDWSTGSSFEVLPANTYLVEITGWKRDRNKNSGNENVRFDGKVCTPKNFDGKPLADFITLTEKAVWRIKAFLLACLKPEGELPAMDTNGAEFENLLNACLGRKMYWNTIVEEYNGKDSNKTAQNDPYTSYAKAEPFAVENLTDVPEWVKSKEEA